MGVRKPLAWAVLGGVAALIAACAAEVGECEPGQQRTCHFPSPCAYLGRGGIVCLAVDITSESTCTDDGTWDKACYEPPIEPECASVEQECDARCSESLVVVLKTAEEEGLDVAQCRAAAQALIACHDRACSWLEPGDECCAELHALDAACTTAPVYPLELVCPAGA